MLFSSSDSAAKTDWMHSSWTRIYPNIGGGSDEPMNMLSPLAYGTLTSYGHQNHVNNARYLEFFEEGSWDFLEKYPNVGKLMESLAKKGIIHVVVNINCNYRNAAVAGDVLRVETELCRSTNRSFTWLKRVFNDNSDILVVDAEITCVFIDSVTGKVVPISEEMQSAWPELADQLL